MYINPTRNQFKAYILAYLSGINPNDIRRMIEHTNLKDYMIIYITRHFDELKKKYVLSQKKLLESI